MIFFVDLAKPLVHLRRDAEIAELNQQVAGVSDAIALRRRHGALQIFVREMKVTAQVQFRSFSNPFLEILQQAGEVFAIIEITIVRMGGGDDVLDAILHRHPAHALSGLPGFRAVVHFGQDVAVDVDHVGRFKQIRQKDSKAKGSPS